MTTEKPTGLRPEVEAWKWVDTPATTIAGDPRITAREHHYHGEQSKTSLRLTLQGASILQTFPTIETRTEAAMNATAHIKALDLFAGTGWGVACKRLGIKEAGVEIMPEAVATRTANGMETIYNDVWDGLQLTAEQHREQYGSYGLLIASPPCQTFSLAGKGTGRAALDEVLEAIELHAYKDADALLRFGEQHDMRTALVLSPLAYVWRDRPRLVAFEQVPAVLPVWEACAEVMREWGYDVKVEILNGEQYGVPQTRKRAILVARRGGPVDLPTPTHSRYYSRTPDKLDPGVLKWVSMAEALGWDGAQHPSSLRSNYGTGGDASKRGERSASQPAPTLTSKADRNKWDGARNVTVDEAAALQSYPTHIAASGTTCQVVDPRPVTSPAPTITGAGNAEWGTRPTRAAAPKDRDPNGRGVTTEEAATIQSYEPPFIWCGTKTKQFLQIGNAVPPLLAEHILAALISMSNSEHEPYVKTATGQFFCFKDGCDWTFDAGVEGAKESYEAHLQPNATEYPTAAVTGGAVGAGGAGVAHEGADDARGAVTGVQQ